MKIRFKLPALLCVMAVLAGIFCVSVFAEEPAQGAETAQYAAEIDGVTHETLEGAFSSVQSGSATIKLLKSISGCSRIDVAGKDITLDLNGFDIGFAQNQYFLVHGYGRLYLTGEGKVYEEARYFAPVMQIGMESGTNTSVVVVDKDVTLEGWAGLFIDNYSGGNSGISTTVYGTLVSRNDIRGAGGHALYVNGSIQVMGEGAPKILLDGATLTNAEGGNGMYLAGYADTTIINSEIDSSVGNSTGIEIRAGKLNITNSSVKGGSGAFDIVPNGNGSTTNNVALAVVQHTTKLPLEVTINSGTFEGTAALFEQNAQNNDEEAVAKIKLDVKNGTFNGSVYSENKSEFISGGTFSEQLPDGYCAPGYLPVENEDGGWSVASKYVASIGEQGYETLDDLQRAINSMGSEPIAVKFLNSCELTSDFVILEGKDVTFDLNGQTVATNHSNECEITVLGKLTLTDSNTESPGQITCVSGSGRVRANIYLFNNGEFVMNGGYISGDQIGISVANNAKVTVNDGKIDSATYAITGNGSDTTQNTTITIYGGEIVTPDSTAIYHPHPGVLNIHGGLIQSATGIEMRTGVLNVYDGKIVGLNPNLVTRNSNNGNTVFGPALAVSKHVTDASLEINIYGGEFDGLYAIYESNHMAGDPQPEVTNTSINIQDGVFKTRNGGTEAVYSQNITGFISGGTFSTEIPEEYCARGYAPVMNDNGEYVVEKLKAVLTDAGADAITAGDGTGKLRFITKAESLSGTPTSYGTYMVPVSIFDKTGLDDCVTVTYTQSIEEGDTYAADLTNIPEEYLGTEIFARSFIFLPGIDNPITVELNHESVNSAMSK